MPDRETLDVYGEKHAEYLEVATSPEEQSALTHFLSFLTPSARIFDLGCGPGHHSAQMMALGFKVSALDATPAFVTHAQGLGVDARLGTFDDLTCEDEFDAIWASFSLLHAPKSDFPRHLGAISRALRPEGHLFLGLKLGQGEVRDRLGRFYAYYEEEELREQLTHANLDVLSWQIGEGTGLAGDVSRFVLCVAKLKRA